MHETPEFCTLLDEIAQKAILRYPDEASRIVAACRILLAGMVTLHADGTATVRSEKTEGKTYTVNGRCACEDAQYRAVDGRCKHRFARTLYRRVLRDLLATTETPATQEPPAAPTPPVVLGGAWRDHEAPITLTRKWRAVDGAELFVCVRADTAANAAAELEAAMRAMAQEA